jgi:hypothetical protein
MCLMACCNVLDKEAVERISATVKSRPESKEVQSTSPEEDVLLELE